MKNIFFVVFFFACSFVFAQTFREVRIFVPPIEGSGRTAEKNYFFKQITYEAALYHSIVRTRSSGDFILRGTVLSVNEIFSNEYLFDTYSDLLVTGNGMEYFFLLELSNVETSEVIGQQTIYYNSIDSSVERFLSIMVFNILSFIPGIEEENNPHNKWLFLNVNAMWTPQIYSEENLSANWLNFGFRVSSEFHFLDFMSLELGMQFYQDWVVVSTESDNEFRDLIMEIPLSLKFVFKPVNYLTMLPYGGISYNFSLMGTTKPSAFSLFFGLQLGFNAGYGMLIIDPRFSMDLSLSEVIDVIEYRRYMIQLGIGYKIGFFPRDNRVRGF